MPSKPKPSVYLHLFHGRRSPTEQLDDWGDDGPLLGPLQFVHTTYAHCLHLGMPETHPQEIIDLHVVNDLIYYNEVYYGDWTVVSEPIPHNTPVLPDLELTELPEVPK